MNSQIQKHAPANTLFTLKIPITLRIHLPDRDFDNSETLHYMFFLKLQIECISYSRGKNYKVKYCSQPCTLQNCIPYL